MSSFSFYLETGITYKPGPQGSLWYLVICSLWNRVIKLMSKWHWTSTRVFEGFATAIYDDSMGKIGQCIIVDTPISSDMLIGLT